MRTQVQNRRVTPNVIDVLLYYHSQGFIRHPRHDAPAVVEARQTLVALDVLKPVVGGLDASTRDAAVPVAPDHEFFTTTERGGWWVEALCRTTCPSEKPAPLFA